MQVIHGVWADGSCCLWAEDSALLGHAASLERAASPEDAAPREAPSHPFACDAEALSETLADVAGEQASAALPGELTLWLPTAQHRPLASPELVRPAGPPEPERPSSRSGLTAWRVPVLVLQPAPGISGPSAPEIIAALVGASDRPGVTDGADSGRSAEIVPGGSLRYLAAVAAMAGDLAERGRVLPTLAPGAGTWAARWRPVLTGTDAQRARELAVAMPPVLRAATEHGKDPAALLSEALAGLTDAVVRARLNPDREGDEAGAGMPGANAAVTTPAVGTLRDAGARQPGTADAPHSLLPPRRGRSPGRVPVAERWAEALTGDPQVTMTTPEDEQEASKLSQALEEWRAAAQAPAGPVRTCFRLVEPGAESIGSISEPSDDDEIAADGESSDAWAVEFALQSTDDPSLVLSAADVWAGATADGAATTIVTGIKHPEEELLAGLGRAARLFPELDAELHAAEPQLVSLDTGGAYRFLKETAPLLSAAGFGVLLPAWARKARLGLRLTTRSSNTSNRAVAAGRFGLRDLVDFRYDLAVGDQALDPEELEELASLKVPLVRLRGQWVELDHKQLQAALRFMQRARTTGTMNGADALLAGLRGPDGAGNEEDGDLPVTAVDADGWLGDLLSGQTDRRLEPIPAPAGFHGELRPYQERGLSWLSFLGDLGLGGVLADSMGLGKCCSPRSSVFVNGGLVTAEEAWERFAVNTWNDGEGEWSVPSRPLITNALACSPRGRVMRPATITRLYRQHVREKVRRVRLDDGSEITITRQHRLLGLHDWTQDVSPGDRICVPARLEWSGEPVDPDLTVLLAWQISEGYENPAFLTITQKNAMVLGGLWEHAQRVAATFGLKLNNQMIHRHSSGSAWMLRISSVAYRRFLEERGYVWGKKSAEKRIPDFIVAADDDTLRRFLREYFSAEGSVLAGMRSVEISSASPWLMQQLGCMLRRFGIWLRITRKRRCATNGTRTMRPYYFGLIGGSSLRRFHEHIGFSDPLKQAKLVNLCVEACNTNVEGVPGSDVLALTRSLTKLPTWHFGLGAIYFTGSQQLSKVTAGTAVTSMGRILSGEALAEYSAKPRSRLTARTMAAYQRLENDYVEALRDVSAERVSREVFYARVVSVEEFDYTGWVYDFEVAEHHNYVAGGMLCHNTVQVLGLLAHEKERAAASAPGYAVGETERAASGTYDDATTRPGALDHATAGAPLPGGADGDGGAGRAVRKNPTLLVCPMSLVGNWQREAERFTPGLSVYVHHGSGRLGSDELADVLGGADGADLVITTYGVAARDREALSQIRWRRVVCDEAQNIKNSGTRQARAVRGIPAEARLALTGTPVENSLTELWSIMEFSNPGLLGPAERFRERYAVPVERYGDEEAAAVVRQHTGPFILRRLKTDKSIISDLPEKLEMKVWCNLTAEQASLYQATVQDMMARIESAGEGIERRGLVLATMAKLKQVCNHPAHLLGDGSRLPGRSGKLERLEEICEEITAAGDKALCFTQYAEFGAMLQPYLAARLGCEVPFLHGGVPKKQRDRLVAAFQESAEPAVFLLSLKAGGTGLNLTAANHVIHVDRWWNPAVEDQATDRAFRIGQRSDVQVRKFVCVGTLEERIDAMLEEKKALAERIVGSGEGWLTELSTAELREVIALSPEAVSE